MNIADKTNLPPIKYYKQKYQIAMPDWIEKQLVYAIFGSIE